MKGFLVKLRQIRIEAKDYIVLLCAPVICFVSNAMLNNIIVILIIIIEYQTIIRIILL